MKSKIDAAIILMGLIYGLLCYEPYDQFKIEGFRLPIFLVSVSTLLVFTASSYFLAKPSLKRWIVLGGCSIIGMGVGLLVVSLLFSKLNGSLIVVGTNMLIWGIGLNLLRAGVRNKEQTS